jgi:hypothetical protein
MLESEQLSNGMPPSGASCWSNELLVLEHKFERLRMIKRSIEPVMHLLQQALRAEQVSGGQPSRPQPQKE